LTERPESESDLDSLEPSRIIEALLLTSSEPLSVERLKNLAGIEDGREVRALVEGLRMEYEESGRAFTVEEVGGGFRILTRPEFAPWLAKLRRREEEAPPTASRCSAPRWRRSAVWTRAERSAR